MYLFYNLMPLKKYSFEIKIVRRQYFNLHYEIKRRIREISNLQLLEIKRVKGQLLKSALFTLAKSTSRILRL